MSLIKVLMLTEQERTMEFEVYKLQFEINKSDANNYAQFCHLACLAIPLEKANLF